jgi:hypothetical protein
VKEKMIKISLRSDSVQISFGVRNIESVLNNLGFQVEMVDDKHSHEADIKILNLDMNILKSPRESFSLKGGVPIILTGSCENGLMYGCFELAEQIRNTGGLSGVRDTQRSPHVDFRATKINLPWCSYRSGEVMTTHMEVLQSIEFWSSYIDAMALNRFNVITFWNLHPFPYMIRPRNYPESYSFNDAEFCKWEKLWKFIFRRCRERGIEPYILNWNIFVSKELEKEWNINYSRTEYYIGPGDTSERVKKYNRECITQLIDEYEDLAGFGISLGERMEDMLPSERADWVKDVVIEGIKAAKRPIKFIHRAPFTADPMEVRRVLEESGLPAPSYVEYKFNWSHGHSTPRLSMTHDVGHNGTGEKPAVDDRYWNPAPTHHKMLWMIRNEDFFILKWGQSDFIRDHIELNHHDYVGGYIIGSEGYIPGKDYSIKDGVPHDWNYAFEKQWLFYMLWGRLLYHPHEPDETFESEFEARYKNGLGKKLFNIYRLSSHMPLRLASFHGSTWDYTLYSEGFITPFKSLGYVEDTEPFININEFISHPTLDGNYISIPHFVDMLVEGKPLPEGKMTPLMIADASEKDGMETLSLISEIRKNRSDDSSGLECELSDAETWAHLSLYFAHKLRGGVSLHRFRILGKGEEKENAIKELKAGLADWERVVEITQPRYRDVPYIDRTAYGYHLDFHWRHYFLAASKDVKTAEKAAEGVFPYPRL